MKHVCEDDAINDGFRVQFKKWLKDQFVKLQKQNLWTELLIEMFKSNIQNTWAAEVSQL